MKKGIFKGSKISFDPAALRKSILMIMMSTSLALTSCGGQNQAEQENASSDEFANGISNNVSNVDSNLTGSISDNNLNASEEVIEYFQFRIDLSNYVGNNLEEALKQNGYQHSYSFIKSIAEELGFDNYIGSKVQKYAILAICGGYLEIDDEELMAEIDAEIEKALGNIGIKVEKVEIPKEDDKGNTKSSTSKSSTKGNSSSAAATPNTSSSTIPNCPKGNGYVFTYVEPIRGTGSTGGTTASGSGSSVGGSSSSTGGSGSSISGGSGSNQEEKPGHTHQYTITTKKVSNKDGKTHKLIQVKTCSCGQKEESVLNNAQACTESTVKKIDNYSYFYCECGQLLRKEMIEEDHKHSYTTTTEAISNKDGKTHKIVKTELCSCGDKKVTTTNASVTCTEGPAKKEGNYNCYYCTECGQLLRKVEIKEEHTHSYTTTVSTIKTSNNDGKTHKVSAVKKCSCGETITEVINSAEACTESRQETKGETTYYYCECGQLLRQVDNHQHSYESTGRYKYNGNGTHSEYLVCQKDGNEILSSAASACTPGTPVQEGEYNVTYCTVCGGKLKEEKLHLEHSFYEGNEGCDYYRYCYECDYKEFIGTRHTSDGGKSSGYLNPGAQYSAEGNGDCYSNVEMCVNCGAIISNNAVGHDFSGSWEDVFGGSRRSCANGCGAYQFRQGVFTFSNESNTNDAQVEDQINIQIIEDDEAQTNDTSGEALDVACSKNFGYYTMDLTHDLSNAKITVYTKTKQAYDDLQKYIEETKGQYIYYRNTLAILQQQMNEKGSSRTLKPRKGTTII